MAPLTVRKLVSRYRLKSKQSKVDTDDGIPFPIVQTVPVAKGSPEYEMLRDGIVIEQFDEKVPKELRLPRKFINNPPTNVTQVPRECGLLTKKEIDITENYDVTALAEAISEGKLTSVAVATAFGKRAIIAHQLTCCLTEWFMDEAIERARYLDEYLEEHGKPVGPLHGVPISIKEHMQIAHHWSADGFIGTRYLDTEDAHLVAILRDLGAVFYCKTNQPQAIMHLETISPYGRTLNPYNINLSAGGSSGGEAALIALRGSILGMGTDIGGGIRTPAAFCGIYGFKPTSNYLPMNGVVHNANPVELIISATCGPMATSLRDLDLVVAWILSARSSPHLREPNLVPLPWTGLAKPLSRMPLKIGFMMSDGLITPQPPVLRALQWAQSKLSNSFAIEVKAFEPYRVADAMRSIRKADTSDGGAHVEAMLAETGEPMEPLTQWYLQKAEKHGLMEIMRLKLERDDFRCKFAQYWQDSDVDVVICPAYVGPACAHDTGYFWNYSAFWNYVDFPGVVWPTPIKGEKKGEESYAADWQPLSDDDVCVRKLWDEGDFEGAPINLQMVTRRYQCYELFAAMGAIHNVLGLELDGTIKKTKPRK